MAIKEADRVPTHTELPTWRERQMSQGVTCNSETRVERGKPGTS